MEISSLEEINHVLRNHTNINKHIFLRSLLLSKVESEVGSGEMTIWIYEGIVFDGGGDRK